MEYKNIAPFINRQEEMAYIQQWIEEEPKSILFFYGPKSSGKTTLIYKFVDEHLSDEKKFSVKLFNLREVLLFNYEDFLECFFELGYQVFMEGPIKSPQRLPVRNIENQRRSDFFPARRCDNQAV
ncbi:MAG: ATP-binding protein [Desulfobacteraceae bacterium]